MKKNEMNILEAGLSRRSFISAVALATSMVSLPASALSSVYETDVVLVSDGIDFQNKAFAMSSVVALSGDRLVRLDRMERLLQARQSSTLALHLDPADMILFDVAVSRSGVVLTQLGDRRVSVKSL